MVRLALTGRRRQPALVTVMISAERPAREIHQIVEAIIEQLTRIIHERSGFGWRT